MAPSPEEIGKLAAAHAFAAHAAGFRDPTRGGTSRTTTVPIGSVTDLTQHVIAVLSDSNTLTFRGPSSQPWRLADYYYHEPTNTLVTVPANPANSPTAFRPEAGKAEFERKRSEIKTIDGRRPTVRRLDKTRAIEPDRQSTRRTGSSRTTLRDAGREPPTDQGASRK